MEARDKRIFEFWLACWTQEEIAEREDLTHRGVGQILEETAYLPKLPKSERAAAEHATDFDVPIYNIWAAIRARALPPTREGKPELWLPAA